MDLQEAERHCRKFLINVNWIITANYVSFKLQEQHSEAFMDNPCEVRDQSKNTMWNVSINWEEHKNEEQNITEKVAVSFFTFDIVHMTY